MVSDTTTVENLTDCYKEERGDWVKQQNVFFANQRKAGYTVNNIAKEIFRLQRQLLNDHNLQNSLKQKSFVHLSQAATSDSLTYTVNFDNHNSDI